MKDASSLFADEVKLVAHPVGRSIRRLGHTILYTHNIGTSAELLITNKWGTPNTKICPGIFTQDKRI